LKLHLSEKSLGEITMEDIEEGFYRCVSITYLSICRFFGYGLSNLKTADIFSGGNVNRRKRNDSAQEELCR